MKASCLPLLAAALCAALAACSPAEPGHDVAYSRAHADDRAAEMAKCRNDPGQLGKTADCVNAERADGDELSAKAWATPKPESRVRNPGQL